LAASLLFLNVFFIFGSFWSFVEAMWKLCGGCVEAVWIPLTLAHYSVWKLWIPRGTFFYMFILSHIYPFSIRALSFSFYPSEHSQGIHSLHKTYTDWVRGIHTASTGIHSLHRELH
jgi:hypothetical protein